MRFLVVVFVCLAGAASAEMQSLFPRSTQTPSALLHQSPNTAPASLFRGGKAGLFAPILKPLRPAAPLGPAHQTQVARLLSLIASAEAGRMGYDAVQHGAKMRPTKRPTEMTLDEIYGWIKATPGQPHAIGRYQFIPATLYRVATQRGYGPKTRFTPAIQDDLAMVLLADAGLQEFEAGALSRTGFMRNLAKIWAGLPLPSGKSYYHGHAGNAATMSWATFEKGMQTIWDG